MAGVQIGTVAASSGFWWTREDLPAFLFQSDSGWNAGFGRLAVGGLAHQYSLLHLKVYVFVHFYSGYRRPGDIHQVLEERALRDHVALWVISVDMCMQKDQADLGTASALRFWKARVLSGQIIGLGGGPPCETWSAARHQEEGPPPLRSLQWPQGLPWLSTLQWRQVLVGSRLMAFHIEMMWTAAITGACAWMEHPQYPVWLREEMPPSVWTHKELHLLKSLQCTSVVSFDQCAFGSSSRKPTTLMLIRLRNLRNAILRKHWGRCVHPPSFHTALQGRDETGAFRTAAHKVYPPQLNRVISDSIYDFVKTRFDELPLTAQLPSELTQFTESVFADQSTVQPDFYG